MIMIRLSSARCIQLAVTHEHSQISANDLASIIFLNHITKKNIRKKKSWMRLSKGKKA
jgi:hypothetical protein